jgi:hypothetical protein
MEGFVRISRKIPLASSFAALAFSMSLLSPPVSMADEKSSEPAVNAEASAERNTLEQEIVITEDRDIIEIGEGAEFQNVREYQEHVADERGDDVIPYGTAYGYLSNGVLKVESIGCSTAMVEYRKTAGSAARTRSYSSSKAGARW